LLLIDLLQYRDLSITNPIAPFVFALHVSNLPTAAWWQDVFGITQGATETIKIRDVIRAATVNYDEQSTLQDCLDQEQSFYYDFSNQYLYIHYEHDHCNYTDDYEYGRVRGFSKGRPVHLDGIYYEPFVQSVPSLSRKQDVINQERLSFMTGTVVFNNEDAVLDDLINYPIYGNMLFLYWLTEIKHVFDYSSATADIKELMALYVQDYDFTLRSVSLRVQDPRKSRNIKIPDDYFTIADYPDIADKYIDKPIPLAYGTIRMSDGIPVNGDAGSGTITFRQAVTLTSLGTVYVENDDGDWISVSPASTNLTDGEFTLSEANGRKSSGDPRNCKISGSVGIEIDTVADIIVDLHERYLGIIFNDSNYDTAEWELESAHLSTVGVLFDKHIELYEAIRQLQAGANKTFRFDFLPDGRMSIRVNDWDRSPAGFITREDIQDIHILSVKTDSSLLAADIEIEYAQDYSSSEYLSERDTSKRASVIKTYRQQPLQTFTTLLPTRELAAERASWEAERLSVIHGIVQVTLMDQQYIDMRIYDMIQIEVLENGKRRS